MVANPPHCVRAQFSKYGIREDYSCLVTQEFTDVVGWAFNLTCNALPAEVADCPELLVGYSEVSQMSKNSNAQFRVPKTSGSVEAERRT